MNTAPIASDQGRDETPHVEHGIPMYRYMCVYVNMGIHICVCKCVYIYMYVYIYICI
jgi:hypothetical protein